MKTWQELKAKTQSLKFFLRKLLWHKGFRYRVNYKNLLGISDIYLPKHKTAIFVNGCFWCMHENCKYSSILKSNYEFWKNKLEGNVEIDKQNYIKLERMGIKVIVV